MAKPGRQFNPHMKVSKEGTPHHMHVHGGNEAHTPHKPGDGSMFGKSAMSKRTHRHYGRK